MRRLAVLLAVATLLPFGAARATDAVEGPRGSACRLLPTGGGSTGVLVGGPYAAAGTLRCTVGATTVAATGDPVVLLLPKSVPVPSGTFVSVCTSFTSPGGQTLYLEQNHLFDLAGHWTTSPSASCGIAPTDVPEVDPFSIFDPCTCDPWTDPVVCGYLQSLYPGLPPALTVEPSGDTYYAGQFFWDCPPYEVT